jgi:hypothetical protein
MESKFTEKPNIRQTSILKKILICAGRLERRLESADAFLKQSPDHLRSSDTHLVCARIQFKGHSALWIRGER